MLELLIMALASVVATAVVACIILTIEEIVGWFMNRNDLLVSDQDNIAFTLETKLQNQEYSVIKGIFGNTNPSKQHIIQGIYNRSTKNIKDYRPMEVSSMDSITADAHRRNELVVYQ